MGAGYFGVSAKGDITVTAHDLKDDSSVSLLDIVNEIRARGMDTPVLVRFENLLAQQITQLNEAFRAAIRNSGYQGEYRAVYSPLR